MSKKLRTLLFSPSCPQGCTCNDGTLIVLTVMVVAVVKMESVFMMTLEQSNMVDKGPHSVTIAFCSLQSHPGCGLQRGWRGDGDLIKVKIGDD